jgi:phosphoglycolate phosphatase
MKKTNSWKTLLWDLDGTITDPRKGIIDSYKALLKDFSVQCDPNDDLLWVIGPPLRDCLAKLLNTADSELIEKAVRRYRYWYVEQGLMYHDTPYQGIESLLTELKLANYRMFVATAKAHPYARLILRHWRLESFFEDVHGSELDGTRSNKADLLKWIIETNQLTPLESILMIGDRQHDVIAAKKNGLRSMGVGYGYGSKQELEEAGMDLFCQTIPDMRRILLG